MSNSVKFVFPNKTYVIPDEFPFIAHLELLYGFESSYPTELSVADTTFELYMLTKFLTPGDLLLIGEGISNLAGEYFKIVEALEDYSQGADILNLLHTSVDGDAIPYYASDKVWRAFISSRPERLVRISEPGDVELIARFRDHLNSTPSLGVALVQQLMARAISLSSEISDEFKDQQVAVNGETTTAEKFFRDYIEEIKNIASSPLLEKERRNWQLIQEFIGADSDSEDDNLSGLEFHTPEAVCIIRQNGTVEVSFTAGSQAGYTASILDFVPEISEADLVPVDA